ncbi:hypothetical protein CL1_0730 [Thermococcus cleftensis]|uniref:DUF432 domain-containing protein n=1 Tax=Thermococcus cleftensis (strain DSM 27260 / KACC 17922 / CL1) TaxID=163003 RepID=I3ZTA1_THECF|nr:MULTISPECIES: DUF432 domain-containing protein [Thermococcus]AFL94935.1 hypothetical protein CL1_0730 [Thermococcus cleftensis]NJE03736.1 DUF432 domain-containing protein [Thermococcus sp. MV11]
MFGEHELRTQFIKIIDKKIHLVEESENWILYRREGVQVLIKKGKGKFLILPAPAEGYGVKFLMIRLSERIAIPPKERIVGYLSAPIDISIRSGDLEIDRFTVGREKYSLYGEKTVGVIARYHESDFYESIPDSPAVVKLVIYNPTESWKMVERVVFPIRNSVMFYSEERAYYPLIILLTKEIYEVNNTGNPPDGTLRQTHRAEPLPNFRMRWL